MQRTRVLRLSTGKRPHARSPGEDGHAVGAGRVRPEIGKRSAGPQRDVSWRVHHVLEHGADLDEGRGAGWHKCRATIAVCPLQHALCVHVQSGLRANEGYLSHVDEVREWQELAHGEQQVVREVEDGVRPDTECCCMIARHLRVMARWLQVKGRMAVLSWLPRGAYLLRLSRRRPRSGTALN